jgi:hypothetical protein
MLPETTAAGQRTRVFATYNLVGSLAGAVGALAAGLPSAFGLETTAGYRTLLWGYAAAAAILLGLYTRLSPRVEAAASEAPEARRWLGVSRSRGIVGRLAALFALDAFAGGFVVQGLVAYWFYLRWGLGDGAGRHLLRHQRVGRALFLLAAPIARRIGLLNTMVFTHLPSNVLLLLIPLMPDAALAVTMLLLRHLASQLDVPTRQSYTMAVVDPDERAAAAGLLAVARNGAAAVAPAFAGAALVAPALGLPFLVAGPQDRLRPVLRFPAPAARGARLRRPREVGHRARPKVDRVACPWAIRRFVDPEAQFLYVPPEQVRPSSSGRRDPVRRRRRAGAPRTECTFDAIVRKYRLADPALHALADRPRADTAPGTRPESCGLEAVAEGFRLSTETTTSCRAGAAGL